MKKSLLRNCKACGRDVSRHSPFCRNCGHPQAAALAIWLLVAFLLLNIAFYLAFTVYCMRHVHEFRVSGNPLTHLTAHLHQDLGLLPKKGARVYTVAISSVFVCPLAIGTSRLFQSLYENISRGLRIGKRHHFLNRILTKLLDAIS